MLTNSSCCCLTLNPYGTDLSIQPPHGIDSGLGQKSEIFSCAIRVSTAAAIVVIDSAKEERLSLAFLLFNLVSEFDPTGTETLFSF